MPAHLEPLSEEPVGEERDGFPAEAPAARFGEQRDPDLADARREPVLRRAGLDVADQVPVALDGEADEAVVDKGWVPLDLLAEPFATVDSARHERRWIALVRGRERVEIGEREGTESHPQRLRPRPRGERTEPA